MSSLNFHISVDQPDRNIFVVGIQPIPVMKWHDVVNAREDLRNVIRSSVGIIDRRAFILQGALDVLQKWGAKGILFPENWVDGDEYVHLLKPLA